MLCISSGVVSIVEEKRVLLFEVRIGWKESEDNRLLGFVGILSPRVVESASCYYSI